MIMINAIVIAIAIPASYVLRVYSENAFVTRLQEHGAVVFFLDTASDQGIIQYGDSPKRTCMGYFLLGEKLYIDFGEGDLSRDRDIVESFSSDRPEIDGLSLATHFLDDKAIAMVAQIKELRYLDLSKTSISARGLQRILRIVDPVDIALNDTSIGDDSIVVLAGEKQLRKLNVSHSKVTVAGVESLKSYLPNCEIER